MKISSEKLNKNVKLQETMENYVKYIEKCKKMVYNKNVYNT